MYIPPPYHPTCDDVGTLSATFVFSSCVNHPCRYGRRVDVTSNWAAAAASFQHWELYWSVNGSGISVCRTTGSYWVSSILHASIGDNTFTDAKGSVYDSHFSRSKFPVNNKSLISLFNSIYTIRKWSLLFLWTSFYHATPVALLRHYL